MTTTNILQEADLIVSGDREATYGTPGKNLDTVAKFWTTWLHARGYSDVRLGTDDVCAMMSLLKHARLANDPTHRDSQVDSCGYLRLMERVQTGN